MKTPKTGAQSPNPEALDRGRTSPGRDPGTAGPLRHLFRRLWRRLSARIGMLFVAAMVFGALAAPWLTSASPAQIDLAAQLAPPSATHPLGTDFYGRDLLSRALFGGRLTLAMAGGAVAVAVLLGTAIGLLAGTAGGWLAQIWVGLIDLLLAFPALLLALVVAALLGPGPGTLAIAVGIAGIPTYARLTRSIVLTLRVAPYVEAARSLGASPARILTRHLLPGVIAPVLALATIGAGTAILNVAALGFLGLGVAPPQPEWGLMLYEGRQYLATAPMASLVPGLAIALTVLGVTLLGDALGSHDG